MANIGRRRLILGAGCTAALLLAAIPAAAADDKNAAGSTPAIWKQPGVQAKLLAEDGARLDARKRLAERLARLPIRDDGRTLLELAANADVALTRLEQMLLTAKVVSHTLDQKVLLASTTISIEREAAAKVLRFVLRLEQGAHERPEYATEAWPKEITVTGYASPPAEYVARADPKAPEWASRAITVTAADQGSAEANEAAADASTPRLSAAVDEARKKLSETVRRLPVTDSQTVSDVLGEDTDSLLNPIIAEALVISRAQRRDEVRVVMEVVGMRVWRVTRPKALKG